jgi:SAM-dependent methyltransferase
MSTSEALLQFSDLAGGIEDATRQATGQPMMAQSLILGHLARFHPFGSVADVGCGGGNWLYAARALGATRLAGFDLVPVPDEALSIDRELITIVDLTRPMQDQERYDLAISTEVAEHVGGEHADAFLKNLCGFSDIVLFSAALPYQGGIHHVNEQWVEYWNRKFRVLDFVCFDIFREAFWNDARIPYFYRQNCLLYVRTRWVAALQARGLQPSVEPRSLVHPELLLQAVNRARPKGDRQFLRDAQILYRQAIGGETPEEAWTHGYGQERLWG